jgi:DNA-binding MarR family transcriptional regulator
MILLCHDDQVRTDKNAGASRGRRPTPEADGAQPASFLLTQVGSHAAARFAERVAALGLTPPQAGVLRQIARCPAISQRALGARLGISASRLVGLIDELEERGLVDRRDDPADRRSYALQLSDAGLAMLKQVGTVAREHDQAVCEPLTPAERATLGRLLRRLAEHHGLTPGVHPGYRSM